MSEGDCVLFIDVRSGSDFTLDAVWAGLVDRFGPRRVVDFGPCQDKHREGVPKVTGDVDRDYGAERRSLCYTPRRDENWMPRLSVAEINGMFKNGQFTHVFLDERQESYHLYLQTVARFYDVPVIVIAGHDRFWNSSPDVLRQYYGQRLRAMFLDNWRDEYDNIPNAFPMNYATNFDHLWERASHVDKKFDIFFMGYNSHPDRASIVDHLVKRYGHAGGNCLFVEKRPNTVESFLPKRDYFKLMAQSRVCINLKGAAECGKALRFYEIPYVGSFMLSQTFTGVQVHPFVDGVHCKYFKTIEEMDHMIDCALKFHKQREQIARDGHEHAMRYHTASNRVDYIYEKLMELE